jgi:acetolactate synthase-1/2/3 large subunit
VFGQVLSQELDNKAVIIPDDGGHLTWIMQSFEIKQGQKLFSAFGNSPMGYAFPAAIGASIALGRKEVICIDGDGSFLMNIQELQTLFHLRLPVKVFIFDNKGYGIIRQFQKLYLDGHYEATQAKTGVTIPDYNRVGKAFGLTTCQIKDHRELRSKIRWVLKQKGPVICSVNLKKHQEIEPKLAFGKPIEDLAPLLPRSEFAKNMLVKTIEADESLTEAN